MSRIVRLLRINKEKHFRFFLRVLCRTCCYLQSSSNNFALDDIKRNIKQHVRTFGITIVMRHVAKVSGRDNIGRFADIERFRDDECFLTAMLISALLH